MKYPRDAVPDKVVDPHVNRRRRRRQLLLLILTRAAAVAGVGDREIHVAVAGESRNRIGSRRAG